MLTVGVVAAGMGVTEGGRRVAVSVVGTPVGAAVALGCGVVVGERRVSASSTPPLTTMSHSRLILIFAPPPDQDTLL
jgi:hypothetical protein